MPTPTVSVIIPVRNEVNYIWRCLNSLLSQTYPTTLYEVIVVDGRSSDGSKECVLAFCCDHPNVRCLENTAGIVPRGMNIGIQNAHGEIIIRADGHTIYPAHYIETCVNYLEKTGADNVGGPVLTIPASNSFSSQLVAAVLASPFGVGDAKFRTGSGEGYVDTVPFGAFRRELFDRVGMYNEKLVRNQDIDLNARIRKAGGRIFQTPALTTEYHPVAGFWELLDLTFRNCQWHFFSVSENSRSLGLRHFTPAAFVVILTSLTVGSFFSRSVLLSLFVLLFVYLVVGFRTINPRARKGGTVTLCTALLACFCFHFSYGVGTLAGLRYLLSPPPSKPIRTGQAVS